MPYFSKQIYLQNLSLLYPIVKSKHDCISLVNFCLFVWQIEIANFELFSSSPKDFRVYISDRFPTRDWTLLGQFTAFDERTIQNFMLEQELFGKFIKVCHSF